MVKPIRIIFLVIVFVSLFYSCGKISPGGFWATFQKENLVHHFHNQGPRGGYIAMYWSSPGAGHFQSKNVISFAEKNGWELKDSSFYDQATVLTWMNTAQPVFPLSHTGFSPEMRYTSSAYDHFPRWINADLNIYTFTTGWVAIEPGTDESMEKNGFVLLSTDGKEMSVYHLWGE